MAKPASITLILTIAFLLASTPDVYASKQGPVVEEEINFLRDTCRGKEKLVKLHFYVHFFGVDHPNATTYEVARASITGTSPTSFGRVLVQDSLVTAGPDPSSQQLGRYQGIPTRSNLSVIAITLNDNMYFTSGEYAGSTLSFLGRAQIGNDDTREAVVAGGTGSFRFAHGYSTETTYFQGNDFNIVEFYVNITFTDKCIPSDDVWISKR